MTRQFEIGEFSIEVDGSKVTVRDAAGWIVEVVDIAESQGEFRLPNGDLVSLADALGGEAIAQMVTASGSQAEGSPITGNGLYRPLLIDMDGFSLQGSGVLDGTDLALLFNEADPPRSPRFDAIDTGKGGDETFRSSHVASGPSLGGLTAADRLPGTDLSGLPHIGAQNGANQASEWVGNSGTVPAAVAPISSIQMPSNDDSLDSATPPNSFAGAPNADNQQSANGNSGGSGSENAQNGQNTSANASDTGTQASQNGSDNGQSANEYAGGGSENAQNGQNTSANASDTGTQASQNGGDNGQSANENAGGGSENAQNGDASANPQQPNTNSNGNAPAGHDNGHGNDAGGYDSSNPGNSEGVALPGQGHGAHAAITDLVSYDSDETIVLNGKTKSFGSDDAAAHVGEGIDIIDISNGQHQTITLSIHDILNIVDDNNHLTIMGGKGDVVNLTGDATGTWSVEVTDDATVYSWTSLTDPASNAVIEISNEVQANIA